MYHLNMFVQTQRAIAYWAWSGRFGRYIAAAHALCRENGFLNFILMTLGLVKNLYASVEARKAGVDIPEDGYHGAYIQERIRAKIR